MDYVYKNNDLIRSGELNISIDDRSFRFGDGCFETIPFKNQKCIYPDKHILRLIKTCRVLKINIDLSTIFENVSTLIKQNGHLEGIIRIIVSRGSGSNGYAPNNSVPYFIVTSESKKLPSPEHKTLWKSSYSHYGKSSIPITGKVNSSLLFVLSKIEAQEHGCEDAILFNQDDVVLECSSANIFFRKDDVLIFPKAQEHHLPGITQQILQEISTFDHKFESISNDTLKSFDFAYTCNSVMGICPVNEIKPIDIKFKIDEKDPIIELYQNHILNYLKD